MWRDVAEAQGALLHPLNLWRSKSLEALVTASVNMRQWSAALAPARENEAAIRLGRRFLVKPGIAILSYCLL